MLKEDRYLLCATRRLQPIEGKLVKAAQKLAILHQELKEAERILQLVNSLTDPVNLSAILSKEREYLNSTRNQAHLKLIQQEDARSELAKALMKAKKDVKAAKNNFKRYTFKALRDLPAGGGYIIGSNVDLGDIWNDKLSEIYALQDKYLTVKAHIAILSSDVYTTGRKFFSSLPRHRQNAESIQRAAQEYYEKTSSKYDYTLRGYEHFHANVERYRSYHRCAEQHTIISDEIAKVQVVDFMSKHLDDYPGAEAWLKEIRHNSMIAICAKTNTYQVYYGGVGARDGAKHGHVALRFNRDGSYNPNAKPYFRPPNQRRQFSAS